MDQFKLLTQSYQLHILLLNKMGVVGIMPKFGIDVSSFNGDINFTMIKEQIDFVIIRCGYGKIRPVRMIQNMKEM